MSTATLTRRSADMHPRMRSRRDQVRRSRVRRRARRAGIVGGVVVALLAGYSLTRSPLLDVDEVRVRGTERTPTEAVLAASGIAPGDPMLYLSTGASGERIEALPWIAEARVQRVWPGAVRIEVEERTPVGLIEVTASRWALVDVTGRVLQIGHGPAPELPRLTGTRGRWAEGETMSTEARDALTVVDVLTERIPATVTDISTAMDVSLVDGGLVRFGSIDDLEDKVVATETVLSDVDLACLDVLDVRVPGSPALTRHEGCS